MLKEILSFGKKLLFGIDYSNKEDRTEMFLEDGIENTFRKISALNKKDFDKIIIKSLDQVHPNPYYEGYLKVYLGKKVRVSKSQFNNNIPKRYLGRCGIVKAIIAINNWYEADLKMNDRVGLLRVSLDDISLVNVKGC